MDINIPKHIIKLLLKFHHRKTSNLVLLVSIICCIKQLVIQLNLSNCFSAAWLASNMAGKKKHWTMSERS